MAGVITIFYLIIVLIYILLSLFVVYHLVRYSVEQNMENFSVTVFSAVALGLLIANVILFFSINWDFIISGFIN